MNFVKDYTNEITLIRSTLNRLYVLAYFCRYTYRSHIVMNKGPRNDNSKISMLPAIIRGSGTEPRLENVTHTKFLINIRSYLFTY